MAIGQFELSFAGVPFCLDEAQSVWLDAEKDPLKKRLAGTKERKTLLQTLNELLPFCYLQDYTLSQNWPGKNLAGLAVQPEIGPQPVPEHLQIGDWYYPNTARRWSVFRGLMGSSQVKAVLAATGGASAATFVMKAPPTTPTNPAANPAAYTLSTSMHMLPARPLGEHGKKFDGLYLVTLVDERYYWHNRPINLKPTSRDTWSSLAQSIGTTLGVTITFDPAVESAVTSPEPDSPLWLNAESASVLLDAIAYNTGATVVRLLNGSYVIMDPLVSRDRALASRGAIRQLFRTAGGDLFASGTLTKVGDLNKAKNAICPSNIVLAFPKYVVGNDPVPHLMNSRQGAQRPSAWSEEDYGDTYQITVPIASGGATVSGLSGVGTRYIHSTAKALVSGEVDATPFNVSGLTALAMFMAKDCYDTQAAVALDEVYPGSFAWDPEGVHDLIWTYSARAGGAFTRVMRCEWNNYVAEYQHATPTVSGSTIYPIGVGGHTVAQTWRDSHSGTISTTLASQLSSGDRIVHLDDISHLPTQNRWRGQVGTERILFEGTSGLNSIDIVWRGIDGSVEQTHLFGTTVSMTLPDTSYGVNLVTAEKMQFVFPSNSTSGGIHGVNVVPQTQTVRALAGSGVTIKGKVYYSGEVALCDPITSGTFFPSREPVWLADRNDRALVSGRRYDGQFAGFSASGPVSPVYVVADQPTTLASGDVKSGHIASGAITNVLLESISYTTQTVNLTTSLNVLNVTSPIVLLNPTNANLFIYGINVPVNVGFYFEIINIGSEVVTIPDQSASSSGAQIQGPSGDLYLYPGYSYSFKYVNGYYYPIGGYRRLGPAEVASGMVASGGVNSGNIASGTIYTESLSSGTVSSGHVASGAVINDNIASGQVQFFTIGSGAVGSGAIASGQVSFFHITNNAVQSGTIASGQISFFHITNNAIRSGSISSGQVGVNHLASGAVQSGSISSGQIGVNHLASGAVRSGAIASGQISFFHLTNNAILSGSIASGQVGVNHLASGAVQSGSIASGQIGINHLASGSVLSGHIASGQVGGFHLSSGSVTSGRVASGQVGMFHVASGSIRSGHLASGFLANFTGAAELLGATNVTTDESTSSTSYTDLATADSVTFTLGTASAVLVVYLAMTYNSAAVNSNFNIVNIDGADESTTAAESYDTSPGASYGMSTILAYKTGSLSAASHTIKIRHKTDGGTANWRRRMIMIFKAP